MTSEKKTLNKDNTNLISLKRARDWCDSSRNYFICYHLNCFFAEASTDSKHRRIFLR